MTTISCDGAGGASNCGLTLDKWIRALLIRLPGASEATVRCELEAAVHDFYHRSTAWREVVGPLNVSANQYVWLNPVDMYADVQHVFGAHTIINSQRVELRRMTVREPGERPAAAAPDSYYCTEPYTLELYPTPAAALGRVLYVTVALAPTAGTERLPDIAATHHFEGILALALHRLYSIPLKPWTNRQEARENEREASRRIRIARDEANRGHTMVDAPMRIPRWA